MIRRYIILVIVLYVIGCTENHPVQPPYKYDPFATCDNDKQISTLDSLNYNFPYPKYRISLLRVSPYNGLWAGEYERFVTRAGETYAKGVFVYDPEHDEPVAQFDDAWGHSWSPDGRKLVYTSAFTIFILEFPSMSTRSISEGYRVQYASWSYDGMRIFFNHNPGAVITEPAPGIYSMNPDGSDKRRIANFVLATKTFDSEQLITMFPDSVILSRIDNAKRSAISQSDLESSHPFDHYDISRFGDFIVFDRSKSGSTLNPWGNGLWLLETVTWTARKIRDAQWWNALYYPTWASSGTIYASVFCRKDSSSMIWEFDLNGNPLRRITEKTMRVWMQ